MYVEIFSMHAAAHGREHVVWSGEVPNSLIPPEGGWANPNQVNDNLFRFFNRVDEADCARLDALGYKLPSLSAGDFITWGEKTYKVRGIGFDTVTHNPDYLGQLFG